jgi:excisionase family DNA binding protein
VYAPERTPSALLTIEEARTRLGVSRSTLWSWISGGRLPVVRLPGRVVRIDPEDLEAFVRAHKTRRGA